MNINSKLLDSRLEEKLSLNINLLEEKPFTRTVWHIEKTCLYAKKPLIEKTILLEEFFANTRKTCSFCFQINHLCTVVGIPTTAGAYLEQVKHVLNTLKLDFAGLSKAMISDLYLDAAPRALLIQQTSLYMQEDIGEGHGNNDALLQLHADLTGLFSHVEIYWREYYEKTARLFQQDSPEVVLYSVDKLLLFSKVSMAEQNRTARLSPIKDSISFEFSKSKASYETILIQMFYNIVAGTADRALVALPKEISSLIDSKKEHTFHSVDFILEKSSSMQPLSPESLADLVCFWKDNESHLSLDDLLNLMKLI